MEVMRQRTSLSWCVSLAVPSPGPEWKPSNPPVLWMKRYKRTSKPPCLPFPRYLSAYLDLTSLYFFTPKLPSPTPASFSHINIWTSISFLSTFLILFIIDPLATLCFLFFLSFPECIILTHHFFINLIFLSFFLSKPLPHLLPFYE